MQIEIDGKTQAIALGVMSALGFVAALTPSMFPSFIPAGADADIAKTAGLVAGLMGSIGSAMGLFSSSKPGPLAPPDPPIVKAATVLATLPDGTHSQQVLRAARDLHVEAVKEAPEAYANDKLKSVV
jgi:hypothetical protein